MNRPITVVAASALAVTALVIPQTANAASHPHCTVSANPKHPGHNADVTIAVNSTIAHAHLQSVAHYESTNRTRTGTANKHGNGALVYDVSDATNGYEVKVSVTVMGARRRFEIGTGFLRSLGYDALQPGFLRLAASWASGCG